MTDLCLTLEHFVCFAVILNGFRTIFSESESNSEFKKIPLFIE